MRYPFQSSGWVQFHTETSGISRLHDTIARFRTRVKFSPWYNNRGELTPGWLPLRNEFPEFWELIPRNSNLFQDMQMRKDKKPWNIWE